MSEKKNAQWTRRAILGSSLLSEPLQTVYSYIPFLLYKDLGATALAVTVLTMLKPMVSILALYWSAPSQGPGKKLLSTVWWSGFLGRAPFLFFFWVQSPWLVVLSAAFYMLTYRGAAPAWMELLRQNLPTHERSRTYAIGAALAYLEGVLLAIGFGLLLDAQVSSWRWIFPCSAVVGILGTVVQLWTPERESFSNTDEMPKTKISFLSPWKQAWELVKRRPDFRQFQIGYMLCGGGLMLMQPALPLFFVDTLGITYTDLAIALSVCKGLGFFLSSRLWAEYLNRSDIFIFSGAICTLFALFPFFLWMAQWGMTWLYAAYFLYGVAQAGSHLSWNLSGPLFSGDEPSAQYTAVNVVTVGLRGTALPMIGGWVAVFSGPTLAFILCSLLGFAGIRTFFQSAHSLSHKRAIKT